MRTENVELTVLCLIHKDGRYLLQDRVKADWQGFTLPGGHIEPVNRSWMLLSAK